MARVLAISSQVVRGHVGNSAAGFALARLGHEVWPLPTVILSNHPGHARVAGQRLPPATLEAMLAALEANGWLDEVDAVLTGYLPSSEHVGVAVGAIERLRRRERPLLVLTDTVLGDDPKGLYVEMAAAEAVRDRLVPLADIVTPNRFELAWLSGLPVGDLATATFAARRLAAPLTLATSIPGRLPQVLDNLLIGPSDVHAASVPHLARAPHGTGDLLAALQLGHMLAGPAERALGRAVASVRAVIEASQGADELRLIPAQADWIAAVPAGVERVPAGEG